VRPEFLQNFVKVFGARAPQPRTVRQQKNLAIEQGLTQSPFGQLMMTNTHFASNICQLLKAELACQLLEDIIQLRSWCWRHSSDLVNQRPFGSVLAEKLDA
jgi:hypothetical protein